MKKETSPLSFHRFSHSPIRRFVLSVAVSPALRFLGTSTIPLKCCYVLLTTEA